MGLYTYSSADPAYIVTVPLSEQVDLTMSNGKIVEIKRK